MTHRKKLKSLLIISAVVTLLVLGIWGAWDLLLTREYPATIVQMTGTVLYSAAGDSTWSTAKPGMILHEGDQLLTQPSDSTVIAVLEDGYIGFQLASDTLVTYTARWNKLLDSGVGGATLGHGTLVAETRHDVPVENTRFNIETEAAQISLEGSRTIVQKLKTEPTTRVSSLEGEITVKTNAKTARLVLPEGEQLTTNEVVLNVDETVLVYLEHSGSPVEFESNLGRVVDSQTGEGVEGVLVQVVGKPDLFAVTNAEGYFDIPGDSFIGELTVVGTTIGSAVELELQPYTSVLYAKILDSLSHGAIPNARVIPMGFPELALETDIEGVFALSGLSVGSHSLAVVADGYISSIAEVTVTSQGQSVASDIYLTSLDNTDSFLPFVVKNYIQYP
jgi:hypothetical protein